MVRKLLSLMLALLLALGLSAALAEDFDGYYDMNAVDGVDAEINMFLTPDGHGRLVNRTSSVNFDFTVEDGVLKPDSDELQLTLEGDGRIIASVKGMSIRFVRREDVAGGEAFVGTWSLSAMENGGKVYSAQTLALAGASIDAVFYPSGAISWHAVSDSDTTLAQGWGVDDEGFYVHNGDAILRAEVNGDTLTIIHPGNGKGEVKYLFQRAE